MSEEHFDEFEHFNYDQDKMMHAGQSGKFDSSSRAQKNISFHNCRKMIFHDFCSFLLPSHKYKRFLDKYECFFDKDKSFLDKYERFLDKCKDFLTNVNIFLTNVNIFLTNVNVLLTNVKIS